MIINRNKLFNRLLYLSIITFSLACYAEASQAENYSDKLVFNLGSTNNQADENLDMLNAYQAMAGFSYKSEKHPGTSLHVGYTYLTETPQILDKVILISGENNYSSHNVLAGIKIGF